MSFMDSVVGLGADVDKPYSFAAILFITHDVDLAVCYANRVLLMGDGGIHECGYAQNCVEICPKDIPLLESIAALGQVSCSHHRRTDCSSTTNNSPNHPMHR